MFEIIKLKQKKDRSIFIRKDGFALFHEYKIKSVRHLIAFELFGSIEQLFSGGQLHFKVFSCYHTIHDLLLFILCAFENA